MTEDYGNPSARHRKGMEAEQYVKNAASQIAKDPEGKGKGNPLYLRRYGVQQYGSDRHSPCQPEGGKTHHQYTDRACFRVSAPGILESLGFEVTYLSVDSEGHISLEELEQSIRPDTILVSVMYVNNEIGAIEPVEEIASLVHGKGKTLFFHVDAIQAYGKIVIRPKKQGIDLLSVSGHKIHGPKGVGFSI